MPTSTLLDMAQFQNAPISVLSRSAKRPAASRIAWACLFLAAFFWNRKTPPPTTTTATTANMLRLRLAAAVRSAIRRWYSSIPGGGAPNDILVLLLVGGAPSRRVRRKPQFDANCKRDRSGARAVVLAVAPALWPLLRELLVGGLLGEHRPGMQVVERHLQLIVVEPTRLDLLVPLLVAQPLV